MTNTNQPINVQQGQLLTEVADDRAGESSGMLTKTVVTDHRVDADGDRDRATRTRNSVLWAAYGDALGYISEMVDDSVLNRRTNGTMLDHLMIWERRVGGRRGVTVQLRAGCWSDDTQLRMAVSRAINSHGFDVELFARIELPVWPSYALGGGKASKAAAKNLGRTKGLWYANTFSGWSEAGGNGAAMRVQPHVWSSPDLSDSGYLGDVIADSVCTHGHLRAIVGACFHASTLAYCLNHGEVPTLDTCARIALDLRDRVHLIEEHSNLGSIWVPLWEKESRIRLREGWLVTVSELEAALEEVATVVADPGNTTEHYLEICKRLGLRERHQRGSGVLTTVASVALAGIARTTYEAVVVAANALGTDTDTIATMVGALLGACKEAVEPPEPPLDLTYLIGEADRLVDISLGLKVANHVYPDILSWTAPPTQADALVMASNGQLMVEGLGPVKELDSAVTWTPRGDFGWQWVQTDFGQTLLIKRRPTVKSFDGDNSVTLPPDRAYIPARQSTVPPRPRRDMGTTTRSDGSLNIDAAVQYAKENIADDARLGYALREVAQRGTIADLVALTSLLREPLRSTRPSRPPGRASPLR